MAIAIAEWERAPDALLRGLSLSEACEFFSTRAGDLSEHECGFIDASRDAHEQEQLRWRRAYEAALSRQLAAQAEQLRSQPNMLERSVLLATEATRHQQGPEADLTLRRGLTLLPEPVLRTALDTNPRSVDLSPDGSMVVLGSVDGSVRLLRTATGDEAWRINHGGEVYTVAFSPDGQLVASGSETGHPTARISRAASGELVAALSAPASTLVLKFSPNGRYVAGAPGNQLASPPRPPDPFARIWEPVSGRLVTTIECAANPMALVFSEDSHWLAVRTEPGDVQVFAVDTGTLRTRMKKPDAVASVAFIGAGCIVFSHDGRLLAGSDASSGLSVWNADTGELVMSVGHSASVSSVDFSEDDAVLGIGGADGSVRVWQIREQRDIVQVRHVSNVRGTRFLNRGRFATCGEDGAVSVWTARHEGYVRDNGREIVRVVHGSSVMGMAVNANHALLASASWDGTVRVSRLDAGLHERRFPDSREVEDITFSPDATVIATTGTARTALWGAASGAHLADVDNTLGYRVVFSRDQRYLGVVTSPVGIIWDYPVLRPRLRTDASSYANAIAFSPDSTRVAFGATDEVHLWDLASGSRILSVPVEREVLALAYSPDGTCIAVSTGYRFTFHRPDKADPRVYLIDTAAGSRLAELPYRATVHDLVFSPDGRWLLTAGGDRSARLWLMNGLSQAASISHDTGVTGVAFSPDGRHFATACPDGVMVWETVTRKQMVRIVDPVGADTIGRTAVAFNPDGSLLATAMGSCGYTWRWKAEDLVAEACRKLSRDLTEEEWEHYFDDEPYRPTREVEKGSMAGRP